MEMEMPDHNDYVVDKNEAGIEKKEKFHAQDNLNRTLKGRHMSMIAIGGTIGTGLFVASGGVLSKAGPAGALVAYALMGLIVFFVMTSLAEMSTFIPVAGSFNSFADRFVDPAFGFAIAYNYWYSWIVTAATDLVAAGIIVQFWLPNVSPVVWSFVLMAIVVFLNLFGAKLYGEAEFWLALIKVLAIVIFIIIGILVAAGAVGGTTYGFKNWSIPGAPFVDGFPGLLNVFVTAAFSFQGTEIVGVTAGESSNPSRDVPKAIRSIFWRILLFYVLTILLIGMVIPYTDPDLLNADIDSIAISPLVIVLKKSGIHSADHIMNAIILTSVLSAGNSGLYLTSRTLYSLACEKKSFKKFADVSRGGTPLYSLALCSICIIGLFCLSLIGNQVIYEWFVAFSGIAGLISWMGISFTHLRFRKAYKLQGYNLEDLPYQASFYPFGPYFGFFGLFFITLAQGYQTFINSEHKFYASEFFQSYIGIPIFIVLYIIYKFTMKTRYVRLEEMDLETDSYIHLGFPSSRHEKLTFWQKILDLFT
ncbi:Lysine-specific permease [Smittium mucronatum]|uniref:Lysine-specific permease n=1 Tax=Smittium mucronatum TaxID=133383 RepID=A0A1R0GV68_9FUNG|nr:Lysine-specific permease [Smittium mucronatum]